MIKKFLTVSLFLMASLAFAEETTLIDFNKITPELAIDFAPYLGTYTLTNSKVSLEPANWNVVLNDSAWTFEAKELSKTVAAPTKTNGTVLGVRVAFPEVDSPAHALVLPPFTIPAYFKDVSFVSQGVVTNVGAVKQIKVTVYGQNYDHTLAIVLQDQSGRIWELPLGSLKFQGWSTLR